MNSISIQTNQIAIFTDIHWGKSRDSETKIKSNYDFMQMFISFVKDNNIKNVIFMGDWFDNRNVISVKTQNIAYDCLKQLAEYSKVYMIIGNHDAYFKESIMVNSVRPYADIKNVFPIENLTEIVFPHSDKKGLMCPWSSFNDTIKNNYDIMFGHFEFSGAVLAGGIHTCDQNMEKLTDRAPIVFSGHFHIRKEYPQKNGKLITAGSPLELDWGDSNNSKGFYTLDTNTLEYTFHENTISPKHIKIYWSKLKRKQETLQNIRGNYVKLVIDESYKFENVLKLLNIINSRNPLKTCETDFIYNNNFNNQLDSSAEFETINLSLSKLDYIMKYIELNEINLKDINIDKLKNYITEYYNLSLEK